MGWTGMLSSNKVSVKEKEGYEASRVCEGDGDGGGGT